MKRKYGGLFEILRVEDREVVFQKWLETSADSVSDAEDRILADAKRARWRARSGEIPQVVNVHLLDPEPRTFFGFRYESSGGYTARFNHFIGSKDYVPGGLYGFRSKKARDEWVIAGEALGEIRKAEKANKLPAGWHAKWARDPETEELL